MTTNQETQNKKKIKNVMNWVFNLKPKSNDLTLEEWERLELRKPTVRTESSQRVI